METERRAVMRFQQEKNNPSHDIYGRMYAKRKLWNIKKNLQNLCKSHDMLIQLLLIPAIQRRIKHRREMTASFSVNVGL